MCLEKVMYKYRSKDQKQSMSGYKVVGRFEGLQGVTYRPWYYSERFTFKIGETYRDWSEELIEKNESTIYKTGFHVYKRLRDARQDVKTKSGFVVIVKVRGTDLQVLGEQEVMIENKKKSKDKGCLDYRYKFRLAPCFICRTMKIIKEVE